MKQNLSPLEKWQNYYQTTPLEALGDLLTKKFYLGELQRNDADEILWRLFHPQSEKKIAQLDNICREWFALNLKTMGSVTFTPARWVEALRDAFSAVVRLNLSQTQNWLYTNHTQIRNWLRPLFLSPARDAEADFLRTLALCQKDQALLPLWLRLCRLEEERPLYFAGLGLLGLCKLPDTSGQPDGDLPAAVFSGVVSLAEAIDRRVHPQKAGEQFWLSKVQALMARYPRSDNYWQRNFQPVLSNHSENSGAIRLLNKVLPGFKNKLKNPLSAQVKLVRFPSRIELDNVLNLITKFPLVQIRSQLDLFLTAHRKYAQHTGNAELLVKTFNNIGFKLIRKAPELARTLIEEAFIWEPENPFLWTSRAKLEAVCGNHARAQALLWQARLKFPEDPHIRTDLAQLLKNENAFKKAEFVYRQAIADFPGDVVCQTGLAEVLKAQRRLPEAEQIYRQAITDFPENEFCRTGLAEVLKAQGYLLEAEQVYRQAMADFPGDVVCRTGLAEVLKAKGSLPEAEAIYLEAITQFPQNPYCHLGLMIVYLLQKQDEKAILLLRQAIQKFPENPRLPAILQKLSAREFDLTEIITEYETHRQELMVQQSAGMEPSDSFQADHLAEIAEDFQNLTYEPLSDFSQRVKSADLSADRICDQVRPENEPSSVFEPTMPLADKSFTTQTTEQIEEEIQLGLAQLLRFAARHAPAADQESYTADFIKTCEALLTKNPQNFHVWLQQGFWLLDQPQAQNAVDFFTHHLQTSKQHHLLGLKLGYLQARFQQQAAISAEEWRPLITDFSERETVIRLVQAQQRGREGNGVRLTAFEDLRRRLHADIMTLPKILHQNEKWLREHIKSHVFKDLSIECPVTEALLPAITKNILENEASLRSISEQCLTNI